jgi:hypothetical protein
MIKGQKLGKIKFSPSMIWAIPFFRAMRPLIPIEKLLAVKSYRTPKTKQEDSDGIIDRDTNGKFVIKIRLSDHVFETIKNKPLTLQFYNRSPRRFWYILSGLCHETSHLKHWLHTPEHFRLECRLMLRCYKVLVKMGVKDLYRVDII